MKDFDLEKALSGHPIKLMNGEKAYLISDNTRLQGLTIRPELALTGFTVSEYNGVYEYIVWTKDGKAFNTQYNIKEMWEDEYKDQSELFERALENSLLIGGCDVDGKYVSVAIVGKLKDGKYIAQQQGGPLKTVYEFCVPEFEVISQESEIENNAYYPEHGDTYWYITFDYGRPMVKCEVFNHSQTSINRREHKNCYRTKENAEAAINKTGMLIYG